MKKKKSDSFWQRWQKIGKILKASEDALNTYDVSKYILDLSYYHYTKKFKTNQVSVIKRIHIMVIILGILFFTCLLIQLIWCILHLGDNSLYGIGICLCSFWAILTIFITPFSFWIILKKYYHAVNLAIKHNSLSANVQDYPKLVYTVIWAFRTHPMFRFQYYQQPGIIVETWHAHSKSFALFIDRLNQYYLDHEHDLKLPTINPTNNNPSNSNELQIN